MGVRQVGNGIIGGFTVTIICLQCGTSECDHYVHENGEDIIYRCLKCDNIVKEG